MRYDTLRKGLMRHETLVTKYDYDLENDSIFFSGNNTRYVSSIDLDGIILDVGEETRSWQLRSLMLQKELNLQKRI